ncbi:MAG: DUF2520 domain-containing protein [Saprospiraceae bacterium]|nr:DUF2520 domain-containing protein [Saprospiraceae bacterium]
MNAPIQHIVLIGAGNMATILGRSLQAVGIHVVQVYNRTISSAMVLAKELSCKYTDRLDSLDTEADLYLLCVSDQAIQGLVPELAYLEDKLIAHTSGATPGSVFKEHFSRYGVFYPLQSLSKSQEIDLSQVPFCVDAGLASDLHKLEKLAQQLSQKVFKINDEQRSLLHVAAVFVNNFSNHLYALMDEWLKEEDIPFDLLRPLILGGALKVQDLSPRAAQTGPAIRADQDTIARHLEILQEKRPDLIELYKNFTLSINPDLAQNKIT